MKGGVLMEKTEKKRTAASALKAFFLDESNFRLLFIMSMFFASLCVVRTWFYFAAGILSVWAAVLFVWKFCFGHRMRYVHNRRLIFLFLGCALFSCLLHFESNLFVNLYYLWFMFVCFFFFYGLHAGRGKNACRNELAVIFDILIASTTIIMLAGIVLLAIFPRGFKWGGDSFAIHENRFVGILFNANVTAFYAVCAMLFANINWAMKLADGTLSDKRKVFYTVCTVINTLALFLSDSNDSLLMLIVYLCFVSFYVLFRGYSSGFGSMLVRLFALVLACIVIAYGLIGTRTIVQTAASRLLSLGTSSPEAQIATGVTATDGTVRLEPDVEKRTETTFEHKNTNLDSGRFAIWRQSAAMFKENPVFGIGKANIVDYGKKYIGGLRYDDFHNGLITILIGYGLVGFNIFMVLSITIAKSMFKAVFRYRRENRRDGRVLMYLTAFACGYCVYSLFEIALLADLSYKVVVFWMVLGLAMSYVFAYERSALLVHRNINRRSHSLYRISVYATAMNCNHE